MAGKQAQGGVNVPGEISRRSLSFYFYLVHANGAHIQLLVPGGEDRGRNEPRRCGNPNRPFSAPAPKERFRQNGLMVKLALGNWFSVLTRQPEPPRLLARHEFGLAKAFAGPQANGKMLPQVREAGLHELPLQGIAVIVNGAGKGRKSLVQTQSRKIVSFSGRKWSALPSTLEKKDTLSLLYFSALAQTHRFSS